MKKLLVDQSDIEKVQDVWRQVGKMMADVIEIHQAIKKAYEEVSDKFEDGTAVRRSLEPVPVILNLEKVVQLQRILALLEMEYPNLGKSLKRIGFLDEDFDS